MIHDYDAVLLGCTELSYDFPGFLGFILKLRHVESTGPFCFGKKLKKKLNKSKVR